MKMLPKVLLNALNNNKNSIYVWVPFTGLKRYPIRISYTESMEWIIQVSKRNDGKVPYTIGTNEVILGYR